MDESYNDCKTCADKLQHRLKWAYEAAQKSINKESTQFKCYYDKKYKCAILQEGDLVLIRVVKPGTDYKIADKWEQDPRIIEKKHSYCPVYELKNTCTGEYKELHCNLLYPLRLARTDKEYTLTVMIPVVSKQNIVQLRGAQLLMDNYFACDCLNCVETV